MVLGAVLLVWVEADLGGGRLVVLEVVELNEIVEVVWEFPSQSVSYFFLFETLI